LLATLIESNRVQIALAKADRFIETTENREGNIELSKHTYTRLNLYIYE